MDVSRAEEMAARSMFKLAIKPEIPRAAARMRRKRPFTFHARRMPPIAPRRVGLDFALFPASGVLMVLDSWPIAQNVVYRGWFF